MDIGHVLELHRAGKLAEAADECRAQLKSNPHDVAILQLLGTILHRQGRIPEAIEILQSAATLAPALVGPRINLAALLGMAGKLPESLQQITQALKLRADIPELQNNLGVTLEKLGRYQEATTAYQQAVTLRPDYAEALYNLGNVLCKRVMFTEAAEALERSLNIDASNSRALLRLAAVLSEMGNQDQAITTLKKVVQLRPDDAVLHSDYLYTLHYSSQYGPKELFEEAKKWSTQHAIFPPAKALTNDRNLSRRLRIGYLSADMRRHTSSHKLLGMLGGHDRTNFQVYCYASVERPDDLTERLKGLADEWRDVVGMSDEQTAALIRRDQIDILIETSGHMGGNRLLVLARRPAPVQVQISYAGTTGVAFVDYRMTDVHCDPPGAEPFYSERLVRMPRCAWPHRPDEDAPAVGALPALRNGYVTFGCLNKTIKITEETIGLWCRILNKVPRSKMMFLTPPGNRGLLERFAKHAIGVDRLVGMPRFNRRNYLQLYNSIDLALDTFPYAGDTTTCDGFWMGVPLITLAGETFVRRRGVSLLHAIGLDDLIATTPDEYVEKAVGLAENLGRLDTLRQSMRTRFRASPLMDESGYMRSFESALRKMWTTWASGSAARDIWVE